MERVLHRLRSRLTRPITHHSTGVGHLCTEQECRRRCTSITAHRASAPTRTKGPRFSTWESISDLLPARQDSNLQPSDP
jgi:hypothetical protein